MCFKLLHPFFAYTPKCFLLKNLICEIAAALKRSTTAEEWVGQEVRTQALTVFVFQLSSAKTLVQDQAQTHCKNHPLSLSLFIYIHIYLCIYIHSHAHVSRALQSLKQDTLCRSLCASSTHLRF